MSYVKGRRLEYRTMTYLERQGFRCIRSAGSHGPVDVVAVNATGGLLVQVKANRLPSPQERETLAAFPCPPGFRRVIHRWRDYGREPETIDVGSKRPPNTRPRRGKRRNRGIRANVREESITPDTPPDRGGGLTYKLAYSTVSP